MFSEQPMRSCPTLEEMCPQCFHLPTGGRGKLEEEGEGKSQHAELLLLLCSYSDRREEVAGTLYCVEVVKLCYLKISFSICVEGVYEERTTGSFNLSDRRILSDGGVLFQNFQHYHRHTPQE